MDLWQQIAQAVRDKTGIVLREQRDRIGGGCINQAVRVQGEGRDFFVKLNDATGLAMFRAEAAGLEALKQADAVRVPAPICVGQCAGHAYLVLEYLPFGHSGDAARLGRELAAQHRVVATQFGWTQDNTIGSTPQPNSQQPDWISFWREQRLAHQLSLAAAAGYGGELQRTGERLLSRLQAFFAGYSPQPSLLHGDLWSGNHGYLADGTPIIFDPAVYYGDRETDIAMTELFGGFGADFYAGYRESWPLDPGYAVRKTLYNLYHVLNHLNLFGGGYHSQALGMQQRLLAELG